MKKLNKFFAILVSLAMMATLCVSMAFANSDDKLTNALNESYLVKYLKITEGVTVPDVTFTFDFAAVDTNGKNSDSVKTADVPSINSVTIKARDMIESASKTDGGNLVGKVALSTLTTGTGDDQKALSAAFPYAGEYVYTVTEATLKTTDGEGNTVNDDRFATNAQTYTLRFYVKSDGNGGTTVDNITVEDNTPKDADGDETATGSNSIKKDATDTDPSDGTDPTPDVPDGEEDNDLEDGDITQVEVEGFTFVNTYTQPEEEQPTPDPSKDKYGAFDISKTVLGDYGDTTADFPFYVFVTFDKDYNGKKDLTLYTMKKSTTATAKEVTDNTTEAGTLEEVKDAEGNTTGYAANITLKDGYVAYFKNLPEGTTVTVTEKLASSSITNKDKYMQTADTITNGDTTNKATTTANIKTVDVTDDEGNVTGTKNASNGEAKDLDATALTYKDAYAKNKNASDFTNESDYKPSTTGIIISNLPYIVLALVAVGGLVAYVVVRRKNDEEA